MFVYCEFFLMHKISDFPLTAAVGNTKESSFFYRKFLNHVAIM
jgi:hypothetical protein